MMKLNWAACLLAAAPMWANAEADDRWFQIRLAGSPTGYFHTANLGQSQTVEEMLFVINRLGQRVEIRSKAVTTEDGSGRFVSARGESSSSAQATQFEAVWKDGTIQLKTTSGGKFYSSTLPANAIVLGPTGVERLSRNKLKKPGDSITFLQFSGDFGKVISIHRTVVSASASRIEAVEETEAMPGKTQISLDETGRMIANARDLPFGLTTMNLTDQTSALSAAKGSELPPEAWGRSLARSNIRLPDPRSLTRVRLQLNHRHPDLGWPPFDGPNQHVLEQTREKTVLEMTNKTQPEKINEAAYLTPNPILQSDDPEVMRLAAEITHGEPDRLKAARLLQDWTHAHMKLDMGIALAPASEVVRHLRGTCIAFSVLLASLERAAGIPSRVVMGLVYVDGIWGGHAWTEIATAGGHWIPLDAAVYQPGAADPARFRFGSYTLADNMALANAAGMQMYGNVDVTVLEYDQTKVPAMAEPFTITGSTYTNPWLGFSVRAPERFQFTKLDAVYPDSTVMELVNGDSKVNISIDPVAQVETKLDGRDGLIVSSTLPARILVRNGQSVWTLTAQGPDAERLLEQVRQSWKWLNESER